MVTPQIVPGKDQCQRPPNARSHYRAERPLPCGPDSEPGRSRENRVRVRTESCESAVRREFRFSTIKSGGVSNYRELSMNFADGDRPVFIRTRVRDGCGAPASGRRAESPQRGPYTDDDVEFMNVNPFWKASYVASYVIDVHELT
jgi:hypothetical protein